MENKQKKKILWVVYDFNQAGGQRYVYEICKALNKQRFEIDLLKVAAMSADSNWTKEYYYVPTLELGCRIFLLDQLVKKERSSKSYLSKLKLTKLTKKEELLQLESEVIRKFLMNYEYINFSGVNVYKTACISKRLEFENSIIHILTAKFQDKVNIYEGYDRNKHYDFVSSFTQGMLDYELEDFADYTHTHYPLCFETVPFLAKKNTTTDKPYKIAVFTRLSSMKPLDPYFYALKLLLERGINAELTVYGAGDADEAGFIRQLKYLYINHKVRFAGHLESIQAELESTAIDLIWFQSNNQLPAGYAALEIAMGALPQVLWDFSDTGIKNLVGEAFPSFTSVTKFVDYSALLLSDSVKRDALGELQRNYVLEHYSSNKHIHILESLFA